MSAISANDAKEFIMTHMVAAGKATGGSLTRGTMEQALDVTHGGEVIDFAFHTLNKENRSIFFSYNNKLNCWSYGINKADGAVKEYEIIKTKDDFQNTCTKILTILSKCGIQHPQTNQILMKPKEEPQPSAPATINRESLPPSLKQAKDLLVDKMCAKGPFSKETIQKALHFETYGDMIGFNFFTVNDPKTKSIAFAYNSKTQLWEFGFSDANGLFRTSKINKPEDLDRAFSETVDILFKGGILHPQEKRPLTYPQLPPSAPLEQPKEQTEASKRLSASPVSAPLVHELAKNFLLGKIYEKGPFSKETIQKALQVETQGDLIGFNFYTVNDPKSKSISFAYNCKTQLWQFGVTDAEGKLRTSKINKPEDLDRAFSETVDLLLRGGILHPEEKRPLTYPPLPPTAPYKPNLISNDVSFL